MPVHGATAGVAHAGVPGVIPGPTQGGAIMGLPYEAPSGGGYEDDSTSPDTGPLGDDLTTAGYDGYSHDVTGGYQDAVDDYDYEDEIEEDDLEVELG